MVAGTYYKQAYEDLAHEPDFLKLTASFTRRWAIGTSPRCINQLFGNGTR